MTQAAKQDPVGELEQAILARAEQLATEYRERAGRSRDSILREAAERQRLREARELAIAKGLEERTFRQRVQASELKLQTQLDRVRWNLVQAVEHRLAERMQSFIAEGARYQDWLDAQILAAAAQIESTALTIAANADDQRQIYQRWAALTARLPVGKTAELAANAAALEILGGVVIGSADGRIRIDQTFEGRLARLRGRIQQTILERLIPGGIGGGNLFTG